MIIENYTELYNENSGTGLEKKGSRAFGLTVGKILNGLKWLVD